MALNTKLNSLLFITVACSLAASLQAQPGSSTENRSGRPSSVATKPYSLTQSFSQTLSGDITGAGDALTGYDVMRTETKLNYVERLGPGRLVFLGASYEFSDYNIDGSAGNAVFDTVDNFGVSARAVFPIEGDWSALGMANVQMAAANDARLSDGLTMTGMAATTYSFSPALKVSFGLLVSKRLENNPLALPIAAIDWDITDRLKLRTLNGAFLTYDMDAEKLTQMDLSVQYQSRSFAVENLQGTVFMRGDDEGAIKESSIVSTIGIKRTFRDIFSVRAFAEFSTRREIEVRQDDNKIVEFDTDSAFTFGVEGGVRF